MKLFLGDRNSLHGRGNFENRQIIQKEFIPLGLLLEFINRLHSPFIKLTVENTCFRYFLYIQVFPYFRSPPHQLKICSFPPVDSSPTTFLFPPTKSLFLPLPPLPSPPDFYRFQQFSKTVNKSSLNHKFC